MIKISTKTIVDFIKEKHGEVDKNWNFINAKDKFFVKCEKGHIFRTFWNNIKNGHWCPECVRQKAYDKRLNKKRNIEGVVREFITNKNGELDSGWKYIDSREKFWIKCSKGHKWQTMWMVVKKGHWCPYCSGNAIEEKYVKNFILNKGGLLSEKWKFINATTKFNVICKNGHAFKTCWNFIQQGSWCPFCSGQIVTKEKIREFIEIKGGKLIDTDWNYKTHKSKFWVECEYGHKWKTSWLYIHSGKHWCPHCKYILHATLLKENEVDVRKFIEDKNGILKNDWKYINCRTKFDLECDKCHKSWKTSLAYLKYNDSWCPTCALKERTNDELYVKKFIEDKGGKLNENWKYVNGQVIFRVECFKCHHCWETNWNRIQQGAWCPVCAPLKAAKKRNDATLLIHWKTGEELVCVGSYEKKTVEYFNSNKIEFLWQSKTFQISNSKSYRPDAYLITEDKWLEIKGYFWGRSKEKWDWFHTNYPNSELWDKNKLKETGVL